MSGGIEGADLNGVIGPVVALTIFIGLSVIIFIYLLKWIKQERSEEGPNGEDLLSISNNSQPPAELTIIYLSKLTW